jgi:hypothetical protein
MDTGYRDQGKRDKGIEETHMLGKAEMLVRKRGLEPLSLLGASS